MSRLDINKNVRMDERLQANRAMWDEWTDIHVESDFYDVERFRRGEITLHKLEQDELGDVAGRKLLHLQCHFGMDTMSWSRLGADVTGVDFSPKAIDTANRLANELGIDARFICSDVYELPHVLEGAFDIVFTSYGVLTWLPDLQRWASVISHFLRDGGTFYIAEQHPAGGIYDYNAYPLQIDDTYFRDEPNELTRTESYADRDAAVAAGRQYQWRHPMSTIITSLANVGLHIDFLHEFPFCMFQRYAAMGERNPGQWHLPDDRVPMLFSLKATKHGNHQHA